MGGLYGGLRVYEVISPEEKKEREKASKWIDPEILLILLGGKWPAFKNFGFRGVGAYHCEDGVIVPYDMVDGSPVPGPNFMLVMVDDVFSGIDPVLVIPDEFIKNIKPASEYKEEE